MSSDPGDDNRRLETRIQVDCEVRLEFDSLEGLFNEYAANLSTGGMFIRTSDPKPVGTIVRFRLQKGRNFNLVKGVGEVVWVRNGNDGPKSSPGMGIHFVELDAKSQRAIFRIVNHHILEGGIPFDLDDHH